MQILELNIKHFGKFQDHRARFLPGVNIIYGGNESGKSTIHAFIRAMFFGIESGRGKKSEEYRLRQPWENPAYFAGDMRLEYKGKIYRIERNFYKNDREVRLICETDGRELSAEGQELQQLLYGLNESAFCNTVFIPQAGSETDGGLAEELQRFMMNFQETRDGNLNVSGALNQLKARKKELEKKQKQEQELLDEKIARKQMEIEYTRQDMERLRSRKQDGQENVQENGKVEAPEEPKPAEQTEPERETAGTKAEQTASIYRRFLACLNILLPLIGVLGMVCSFFAVSIFGRIGLFCLGLLFLVLFAMTLNYTVRSGIFGGAVSEGADDVKQGKAAGNRNKPAEDGFPEGEAGQKNSDRMREKVVLEKQLSEKKKIWQREEQKKEVQERMGRIEILQTELEELYGLRERLDRYTRETEAVDLAAMRIREVSERIYQEAGMEFGRRTSEILEELTEGRYDRVALDEKMQVRVNTPSRLLYLNQVSYGTMNQIYFALRMAAGELLSGYQPLPVILDEAFAMYDEERLEAVLRWLDQSGRQVILFTCQKREKEILDRIRRGK